MTNSETLGLSNIFTSTHGKDEINFRNKTNARDSVSSIEIQQGQQFVILPVKTEDNVAMALAVLGVGRVTDDIEEHAQARATLLADERCSDTEDEQLNYAITNLRAILIAREKKAAASVKDLDDAYALYKLSYPKTNIARDEFEGMGIFSFWLANLRKIRQDPTVLGTL
jgi:hypothetical protein